MASKPNDDHEATLATYLNSFLPTTNNNNNTSTNIATNTTNKTPSRIKCCGTSRSLYCTECCKLLVDRNEWPLPIQEGILDLPFHLDIILSDRRVSSTGFHAHVLLKSSLGYGRERELYEETYDVDVDGDGDGDGDVDGDGDYGQQQQVHLEEERVKLFDIEKGDTIPSYSTNNENTFILFPSEDSIPLSSIAHSIDRLVVLDCKWTKRGAQSKISQISHLPKVHLDNPPSESFFWRWHNAGPGMVSTLEAIYFAALEVAPHKDDFGQDRMEALIHLMWLFGMQRAATAQGAKREGKPLPFSKDGKDMQRDLRRTEKGSEKHLQDIENGRRLKEEAKLKCLNGS